MPGLTSSRRRWWQLVQGEAAQHPAGAGDARVTPVHREAGSLALGVDDHRAQLQQLEVDAALADALLAVQHGAAVTELDGERGQAEHRRGEHETGAGDRDVGGSVQRVPSAASHVAGTPRRR
jgi:hypothetical protein